MRVPLARATNEAVRYGFAVGKVRVLQTRLFGSPTYERLVDAPTFEEQRRVLSDTVYGRYLESVSNAEDVELALEKALDDFYRFTDEANLPGAVREFFRSRYDWANLKAKLKAEAADAGLGAMLQGLGTVPPQVFEGPADALPDRLRSVYEEVSATATREASGPERSVDIDEAVDKAAFADLRRLARESGSDFLKALVAVMTDVVNLKALVRARREEQRPEEAEEALVSDGSLSRRELMVAYREGDDEIRKLVGRVPTLSGLGTAELSDPGRLDVVSDDIVVRFVRKNRGASIGPEPVIAYVLAREAEVMMVRTLLVGRLAGVSSETLRSRLREMYM